MIPKCLQSMLTAALLAGALGGTASAQAPATPPAVPPAGTANDKPADKPTGPLAPLAWMRGCWEGKVNQRDFREEWLPSAGDMMIGVSQTTLRDKTVDFEYLRLESRPEGVFYLAAPSGKNEAAFRLAGQTTSGGDQVFTFVNATPGAEYPQRIIYRHASEGWLYATVEGKVKGVDKQVIFPMRHVDCQTGAVVGS
ncbi:MAG TPA: DUF6265 family protein [Casimicrobiaceae bacterium]|nr:DUF6265 family protein [Casimicrobiaceae bacterium]